MNSSLRTKLSLSYIVMGLFLIAAICLSANYLLEGQFRDYITRQHEERNKELVALIAGQYKSDTGTWDKNVIKNIGVNALEQGMIVKVEDNSGTVWDATVHNNGLCVQMLDHMSKNMSSRYGNFRGGYMENSYPVKVGPEQVGKVKIGYYGPFFLNDNELAFINTLNEMLVGLGLFSLLFALLLGTTMAKRLSEPIARVISAAREIAKGNYASRITEQSNTKEIVELTSTINNLAGTLEQQEVLRKRLTSDVAHELRTPLATLQSHMEAMIDGIWEPDSERLKSCHEEILRINRLVGELEKVAKYESENLILNKTLFDIFELAGLIVHQFEADFFRKGVELKITGETAQVYADKDKLSQVIVNLISNGLKYTDRGGTVEVSVKDRGTIVDISVRDTGIGIPQEDLPFIFERFYRADKSRNRMTGGSGIGLTIVKAVIEAHKGQVSVRSEFNKGTEFTVSLTKKVREN